MKIVVISGPTCSGKTSLALRLCKQFNGEIVSADSRQIYKHMDIGTGKVPLDAKSLNFKVEDTRWLFSGIPVYMYDVVNPDESYSVYKYAQQAFEKVKFINSNGKVPFIVGGSGFYIDVLLGNSKISGVESNVNTRSKLNGKTLEELNNMLKELDPKKYEVIDKNNKVRLIRAIEIKWGEDIANEPPVFLREEQVLNIGLTSSNRDYLYERSNSWVDKIFDFGIIKEVLQLKDLGYEDSSPMKGLVYKSILDFLNGNIDLTLAREKIKFDMHGYIRRQLTWFNRNQQIQWFNIQDNAFDTQVAQQVQFYLNGK